MSRLDEMLQNPDFEAFRNHVNKVCASSLRKGESKEGAREISVPNLDAMSEMELEEHRRVYMVLQAESDKVARTYSKLIEYIEIKKEAMKLRKDGLIEKASRLERRLEAIYGVLPESLLW